MTVREPAHCRRVECVGATTCTQVVEHSKTSSCLTWQGLPRLEYKSGHPNGTDCARSFRCITGCRISTRNASRFVRDPTKTHIQLCALCAPLGASAVSERVIHLRQTANCLTSPRSTSPASDFWRSVRWLRARAGFGTRPRNRGAESRAFRRRGRGTGRRPG
jgi:hypothetical protein